MIKSIFAPGHVALDVAEIAGGECRVEMKGVGADLHLDALVPHLLHDLVAIVYVDAEGLPECFPWAVVLGMTTCF